MKKLLPIILLIFLSLDAFGQAVLTNQDILDLTKAEISEEIIIAKIKNSKTAFDTSVKKLEELKKAGVSDSVILKMMGDIEGTPPTESVRSITVPDGTPFQAEILETVSSEHNVEGDPVTLKVVDDVIINKIVVIKAGAIVKAVVSEASGSGNRGKAGSIHIAIKYVLAVDGNKIRASATSGKQGTDKSSRSTSLTTNGNIFGAMVRGEKAELKTGRIIDVYTDEEKRVSVVNK